MAKEYHKRILLIDDDEAIKLSIEIILKGTKYKLIYKKNPASAIKYLKNKKPDLILLDILLPQQSGLLFLDKLKNIHSTIPVIMISAVDTAGAATEAMKRGAKDYITKPFNSEEVLTIINNLLSD